MSASAGETALPPAAVVVGIDSSDTVLGAVRWAAEEAVSLDTRLVLVHASPFVGPDFAGSPEEGHVRALLARAEREAHRHRPSARTTTRLLPGTTVPALVKTGENAARLVLGVSGGGDTMESLLGSTSLAVSTRARCPVVGVHDWPLPVAHGPVVLGVGSVAADATAIEVAFELAERRKQRLVIVRAGGAHLLPEPSSAQHHRGLADDLAAWRRRYPTVDADYRCPPGSASSALLREAARATAVVLGSGRRGPMARLLLGSTARAVLRNSPAPVIVASSAVLAPTASWWLDDPTVLDPHDPGQLW